MSPPPNHGAVSHSCGRLTSAREVAGVLTTLEALDYHLSRMHAIRFTFAFTYRFPLMGSGNAGGGLTMH